MYPLFVKVINKLTHLKELEKKSEEPKKTSPSEEILLLREIRDELKSQKKTSK